MTKEETLQLKGIAILMMLFLHLHIPGHTRSLSGSILRHKISLKSAILYPFIP